MKTYVRRGTSLLRRAPLVRRSAAAVRAPLSASAAVQRACTDCRDELQRTPATGATAIRGGDVSATVNAAVAGGGAPLPASLRHFFEPRFGHDLGTVRLHTDDRAAASARALDARAYTVGRDIVFGAREYSPDTHAGRRLLAHELTHVVQQTAPAESAPAAGTAQRTEIASRLPGPMLQRSPVSREERRRFELCINPMYYNAKGQYDWFDPKPKCADVSIPADRERAWKCIDRMYWSDDGKTWTWPFKPEPDCTDLKLPVPLADARARPAPTAEELKRAAEAEKRAKTIQQNVARINEIRKAAGTDVEALARLFTDTKIVDDGTLAGRTRAIMDATEHSVIPALQTGIDFKQSGFKPEFHDPWPSSENQVGHFLTAVRLAFDPGSVEGNLLILAVLDAWFDDNIPLRLIIGHEKEPDPSMFDISVGFKKQYRATTEEDIKNFKAGKLDKIKVGKGKGNSFADLLLSHKGWLLGNMIAKGQLKTGAEVAEWIRNTLAASP